MTGYIREAIRNVESLIMAMHGGWQLQCMHNAHW